MQKNSHLRQYSYRPLHDASGGGREDLPTVASSRADESAAATDPDLRADGQRAPHVVFELDQDYLAHAMLRGDSLFQSPSDPSQAILVRILPICRLPEDVREEVTRPASPVEPCHAAFFLSPSAAPPASPDPQLRLLP
jgi:hypothetical protein